EAALQFAALLVFLSREVDAGGDLRPVDAGLQCAAPVGRTRRRVPASEENGERRGSQLLPLRQQIPGDDHALDLRRAFVNLQQLRVTHQFFDRVFLRIPVAAEDL